MISISNKRFVSLAAIVLFAAVFLYGYSKQIYFLAVPLILLVSFFLIQYPHFLFYALMLTIPWSIEFQFNSGLGTDLPDEPLMLLAALSVVFYIVYYWRRIHLRLHPLLIIIGLQFLWIVVTVITSIDVVVSAKYLFAKIWYLLAFLVLPLLLFKDEKVFKRSMVLLLCSMMIVTAVSFVRHSLNSLTFESITASVKPFFRNHVNYSSLLVFMVPLQIAILGLSSSKELRKLLYGVLIFTIAALYFSYARGAWLALLAGMIPYWLLKKKLLSLAFVFFISIVIGGVFWLQSNDRFEKFSNDYKSTIFHSDFSEHLVATYQLKDLSNAERLYRWVAGVRMVKDNWQTGFGPSTFYNQYKSYTLPAFRTYVSDNPERSTVHNYFLLILIEQGVLGCLLFIALVAALFWYAQKIYFQTKDKFWRIVVSSVASILAMQCVINFLSDMIETDKVGSIFYLCVATLIIADIKTKMESNLAADI